MDQEYVATTLQLGWAIEDKRSADEALARARLDLVLAREEHMAVVAELNALYHERMDVLAGIRKDMERPCRCEVSLSFRQSYAEWLIEASERHNQRHYYRAIEAEYNAEKLVAGARLEARAAGRHLYELRKAYAAGLVIDADALAPIGFYDADYDYSCDCPCCTGLYFDDEPEFEDFEFDEEEELALEALRTKLRNKKSLTYNQPKRKRRAARFAC
jgi:hypothetical protein